jgi:hypothetical protein
MLCYVYLRSELCLQKNYLQISLHYLVLKVNSISLNCEKRRIKFRMHCNLQSNLEKFVNKLIIYSLYSFSAVSPYNLKCMVAVFLK